MSERNVSIPSPPVAAHSHCASVGSDFPCASQNFFALGQLTSLTG